ncbi:hypothetical protein F5Y18DRAFT_7079 [Xylariaceae sp. FL1019]|nr:hypothetical protein F5Y18DRAFT_7079 [Xylariaceae sp. FL1019]
MRCCRVAVTALVLLLFLLHSSPTHVAIDRDFCQCANVPQTKVQKGREADVDWFGWFGFWGLVQAEWNISGKGPSLATVAVESSWMTQWAVQIIYAVLGRVRQSFFPMEISEGCDVAWHGMRKV